LKTALEKKQEEVLSYGNTLLAELEEQLGNPDEDLKPLLRMGEDQFQLHLKSQSDSIKEWKLTTLASIATQREQLSSKIKVSINICTMCSNSHSSTHCLSLIF